jgi:hypothetical protein
MGGHGEKLSRKWEQAIAALLTSATIEEAAEKAKVGVTTLRRWLSEPAFRNAYRRARTDVLERTVATLLRLSTSAVVALARNLTCGKPACEIRAALGILEQATRGVELLDLAERVQLLEEAATRVQT